MICWVFKPNSALPPANSAHFTDAVSGRVCAACIVCLLAVEIFTCSLQLSMRDQSLVMFKISELSNHQCQVSVPEDTDADNVWLHEGHLDSTQAELEISQAH